MKLIPLSKTGKNKGKYFAMVDDEDYEYISQFNWTAWIGNYTVYAYRNLPNKKIDTKMFMHRQITNAPKGKDVDHINHNGLNNQKTNLRICTRAQNQKNKFPIKDSTSKYLGVSRKSNVKRRLKDGSVKTYISNKWVSYIKVNRKTIYLGTFETEKEAAVQYNKHAKKHHGEFANLNII